jgi:hypothetical protein
MVGEREKPFRNASIAGPWSARQAADYLDEAHIPLRLATLTSTGWPEVTSLWFIRDGDELLCATQRDAGVARALRRDSRCSFEVAGEAPPYFGVRGQGTARVDSAGAGDVLAALISRYVGDTQSDLARWLLSRVDDEVVLRLTPHRIVSWDYRARMAGTK